MLLIPLHALFDPADPLLVLHILRAVRFGRRSDADRVVLAARSRDALAAALQRRHRCGLVPDAAGDKVGPLVIHAGIDVGRVFARVIVTRNTLAGKIARFHRGDVAIHVCLHPARPGTHPLEVRAAKTLRRKRAGELCRGRAYFASLPLLPYDQYLHAGN